MSATISVDSNCPERANYALSLACVCAVFLIADSAFASMPVLFGAYIDERHYALATAGIIATTETAGLALGSTLSLALLRLPAVDRRVLTMLALSALLLAQLISASVQAPLSFAIARGISGASGGIVQSTGSAWIAQLKNPERPFALYVGMTFLSGALGMPLFTLLLHSMHLSGSYLGFAAMIVIALAIATVFPRAKRANTSGPVGSAGPAVKRAQLFLLPSIVLNFAFNGGVWVYLEQVGEQAHIATDVVSVILSIGMFSALAVTVGIALLGGRGGRAVPLMLAHAILLVSTLMLIGTQSSWGFALAVVLFHIGVAAVGPYYLAALARLDLSGHSAVRGVAAMNIGYSLGPWLLALLVSTQGFAVTIVIAAAMFALCGLLNVAAQVDGRADTST
jgi:predicted MFS family arabinose efflux permease